MTEVQKVRIDKWLWAARFFKTRSLAKTNIEGGKVKLNGDRTKPNKEIEPGMRLTIRQGWDEREVEVIAVFDQRRGAPEAQKLYRETEHSVEKRKLKAEARKAHGNTLSTPGKPTGKQRRQLQRIKREILDE